MIKRLLRSTAERLGYEIRRRTPDGLPFLQRTTCDGTDFQFWIANAHTLAWWGKPNIHPNAELRFLREAASPGAVVFDVGAHHGFQAVLAALWVGPGGTVHAFEPVSANALVLDANRSANMLANLRVVQAAVGRESGRCTMSGEAVASTHEGATPALSLDDYATSVGTVPRLLKVDVEGFEGEVLSGGRRILEGRPFINLELHNDQLEGYGWTAARVLDLLPWSSYEVTVMCRPNWHSVRTLSVPADVPRQGVVNLFLRPRRSGEEPEPEATRG